MLLCTLDKYILTQVPRARIVYSMLQRSNLEVPNGNNRTVRNPPNSSWGVFLCFSYVRLGATGRPERFCYTADPVGSGDAAECEPDAIPAATIVRSHSFPDSHSRRSHCRGSVELH